MNTSFVVHVPVVAMLVFGSVCIRSAAAGADEHPLWQIGKADDRADELALGPDGFQRYNRDGLFIVGRSDPAADWPYAHPGPDDAWAGSRAHRFTIYFGLRKVPGPCRLVVDLLDTHDQTPPRLSVSVNGHTVEHQTPKGGPDASILGKAAAGREHRFAIPIPADWLRAGTNEIAIDNGTGNWVLYAAHGRSLLLR